MGRVGRAGRSWDWAPCVPSPPERGAGEAGAIDGHHVVRSFAGRHIEAAASDDDLVGVAPLTDVLGERGDGDEHRPQCPLRIAAGADVVEQQVARCIAEKPVSVGGRGKDQPEHGAVLHWRRRQCVGRTCLSGSLARHATDREADGLADSCRLRPVYAPAPTCGRHRAACPSWAAHASGAETLLVSAPLVAV